MAAIIAITCIILYWVFQWYSTIKAARLTMNDFVDLLDMLRIFFERENHYNDTLILFGIDFLWEFSFKKEDNMGDDVESFGIQSVEVWSLGNKQEEEQEGSWISGVDKDDEITVFGSISCSLLRGFSVRRKKIVF